MLAILSPAKNFRKKSLPGLALTQPVYLKEAARLARELKTLSPWQFESQLKINPDLGLKTSLYYQQWDPALPGTAAALAYQGLAYLNLFADDFTLPDFAFASGHFRILSALYGCLRPTDTIQPYRLELQCRVRYQGENLYSFWGDKVYREVYKSNRVVVNLASNEYAKLIRKHLRPGDTFVTCDFVKRRRGKLITLPTDAKSARGSMVRYIVKNRLTEPEALQAFVFEGYRYVPELSTGSRYVYLEELE